MIPLYSAKGMFRQAHSLFELLDISFYYKSNFSGRCIILSVKRVIEWIGQYILRNGVKITSGATIHPYRYKFGLRTEAYCFMGFRTCTFIGALSTNILISINGVFTPCSLLYHIYTNIDIIS